MNYLSIGHKKSDIAWAYFPEKQDVKTNRDLRVGPIYFHFSPCSPSDTCYNGAGWIDLEKKIISFVCNNAENKKVIKNILKMDYPGFRIKEFF